MIFRRREPLHERLAREGGMGAPPHDPGPHWGEVGIHGVPRARRWDAVATADAPELAGEQLRFVALPDGALLVEEGEGEGDLAPLAAAVERSLAPAYRAEAVRRGQSTWAVAARRIEIVPLAQDPGGDEVEVAVNGAERSVLVDGAPSFGGVRELEQLGAGRYENFVVRATRLDGELWEVEVTAL